jgi:hypothetical protein
MERPWYCAGEDGHVVPEVEGEHRREGEVDEPDERGECQPPIPSRSLERPPIAAEQDRAGESEAKWRDPVVESGHLIEVAKSLREAFAGHLVATPLVEGVRLVAAVTGGEGDGEAAARGRLRLERVEEPRADPAAAVLLSDDERDHARPRLVVLEGPLRADPAESRDRPVDVDDEHERLRLLPKSLESQRRLLFSGRVAELAEQRGYGGRVVRARLTDLHAVTITRPVRRSKQISAFLWKISLQLGT